MSIDENKVIVRRWNDEIWNRGNLATIDELFAVDFVFDYPPPEANPDREGYKQFITRNFRTWADIHCTIEDMVAEGDKVAVRWTGRGTHKGEFWGVAPTGREATLRGISIIRIEGGKIVEEWGFMNALDLMGQLGVSE